MIQTKITKDIYHGDGTTRRFEVTFDYNTKDNVKQIDLYTCTYTTEKGVTKYNNDVTKITSNYDFEVVNDVTYAVYPSDAAVSDGATPMATGTAIIIMRNTPNEQLSTGQYTSEKVEKQLDRITMVAQELQEQLNRAYQAPEYVDKVNKADFATVANDIDAVNTVAAITEDIDLVNANAENITTVAQNIEDVNATGQNIEDVNTVALNINDVSTVAGIASDVTQVAGISTAVSNVSDNSSDVTLVSDNMASVMTTASSITDVQTVAGIATDVSTVADNNTNVTAVAGNATNINTVANKINKVETVADNISSVNTVSTNISDVTNVSDNMTTISEVSENMDDVIAAADAVELVLPHITEINNVSDNINDIVTVASINSDVSTVATNSSDISSVADNATNINTVASNVSNISTAVSNMAAIIAAPTAATNAANSALNAATSATNAQKWAEGTDADVQPLGGTKSSKGWANRAQELVESIGTVMRYKGSVANYTALQAIQNPTLGDTYNVLDTGANYSWDGSAWDEIGSAVDLSAYRTSAAQDVIDATKAPNTNKVNGIPISNANAYYYAESTSAADAVEKTVSIPAITELNAGQVIIVKPTVTSTVANSTLKLNSFNAYPMLYGGSNITTSTDSKVWSAYIPSIFVFDGSYWRFAGHGADDNTTYTLNYLIAAGTANAGVGNFAVTRYALLMQKLDGTWESLKETSTNYNTGTTKTVNTNGFIPGKIIYYNSTAVKKNGEALTASSLYLKATTVDARYSFNCGATPGWSAGDSIYVIGTIGSDGLFYLDSTTWWSNALPTTQDGKVYMYIGTYVSDAYKITLDLDHPMYYHDGTSVKQYVVAGNKQDKLVSGTNIKTINNTSLLGSGDVSITASATWGGITGDLEDQTDLQNELDSKAPAVLLSHFWSDHIINEMSYLRGDTFSWQSGDVYTAAYNHLVNDLYKDFLFDFRNDSDYYIYGSPTIQDGIVSDITDKQNTIGTASAISLTDNDCLEIKLKLLNTGSSSKGLFDTITSIDSRCMLNTSSGIFWVVNYNSSTSPTVTLPISTFDWRNRDVLYIKLNCSHKDSDNNTTYSISVSTDDISWVTVSSIANYRIQNLALRFGSSGNSLSYGTAVPYSIDLNESHVKKNTVQTETIGNYTITYYEADDKHKICLADQETTVLNIYNATGNARYFILDTTNTRFKLPRWKHNKYQAKAPVIGTGIALGFTNGQVNFGTMAGGAGLDTYQGDYGKAVGTTYSGTRTTSGKVCGIVTDPTKSGIEATLEEDDMYLYFYVGTFTKTAYQETAGLNSELFNSKADLDLNNITSSDKVLNSLAADFTSSTTIAASNTFTAPSCGWINYAPEGNSGTSAILNQGNTGYIQIEGKTIVSSTYVHGSDSAHPDTCWAFIGKGQTCYHTMSAGVVYFYPCKGV